MRGQFVNIKWQLDRHLSRDTKSLPPPGLSVENDKHFRQCYGLLLFLKWLSEASNSSRGIELGRASGEEDHSLGSASQEEVDTKNRNQGTQDTQRQGKRQPGVQARR